MKRNKTERAFTLVELMLVVAIVAVVGVSLVVVFGNQQGETARRQMTLHEMGEIKQAFLRFHHDNAAQLTRRVASESGLTIPNVAGKLPLAPLPSPTETPDTLFGVLQFYERTGLWMLLQPGVAKRDEAVPDNTFIVFNEADPSRGGGWHGPYATVPSRVPCVIGADGWLAEAAAPGSDDIVYPQLRTRFESGFYRVVYFEHRADDDAPVVRRLLLFCSETGQPETAADLVALAGGNRREGVPSSVVAGLPDHYPLDLATGSAEGYDATNGFYFVELLNLDTWKR